MFFNPEESKNPETEVEVVTEDSERMSLAAKITGVFLDPKRTFISLERKPDFIVPLLIVMVAALIFTFVAWPIIEKTVLPLQVERMQEQGLSEEKIDGFLKISKILGIVGPPLTVLVGSLVVSAILLFAGNILLGGSSKFNKVFSVYCYTSLITVLAYAVKLALVMSKKSMQVYISPAALFPAEAGDSVWFKVAGVFDVFAIWQLVVIAIGLGVLFRTTFQKSMTVMGTLYVFYAAAAIIFGKGGNWGG